MASLFQRDNPLEQARGAKLSLSAVAFLVLTLAISLVYSHFKLLWNDELFVLQTDSVSSLAQLVHVQLTCPVSIDPLAYHVLVHFAIRLLGANAFAIRLPSLIGFLLMQICLFFFVRRIANERTAILALALPALSTVLYYSAEGRPYGMLLGLCSLAMVTWQTATRRGSRRTLPLVTLALATALALNTHYYAILFLIPLCAAEIFRTIENRRLDFPVIASIGLGMAGIVFTLPFMEAAAAFRQHFWDAGRLHPAQILWFYLSLVADYIEVGRRFWNIIYVGIVVLIILVLWGCILQFRSRSVSLTKSESVFLILLAALPFFGYVLARLLTQSMLPRYVIPSLIGITPLVAIALSPLFRRDRLGKLALIVLFVAIALAGGFRIYKSRASMRETMVALTLPPEMKAALMANPDQLLYVQDEHQFESAAFYEPDLQVRSRLALVYSIEQEMLWQHHNSDSLLAMHLHNFTHLIIVPYEPITMTPGDHMFVKYTDASLDWTDQAFAAEHANVKSLGSGLGGEVVLVNFLR